MSDSPSMGVGSSTVGTISAARRRIELEDVAALGDVDNALASFYVEQVTAASDITGVTVREIREWFEDELITPQGFRTQVLSGPGRHGRAVVQELENRHLIRAESKRGALWYEIAHDRLVDPIQSSNAAWRAEHLHPLQIDARAWERQDRAPGLLIGGEALAAAELWAAANPDDLTEIDRAYLEACRAAERQLVAIQRAAVRNRRLAIASSSLSILVVLALIATAVFLVKSQRNADEASRQRATAERNLLEANRAKDDAQRSAVEAASSALAAASSEKEAKAQKERADQRAKEAEQSAKTARDAKALADDAKAKADDEATRAKQAEADAIVQRRKAQENEDKANASAARAQEQTDLAERNAAAANRSADRALATSLAVRLQPLLDVNPALAVALAAEALKLADGSSEEVIAAMLDARQHASTRGGQPFGIPLATGPAAIESFDFSADGTRVATIDTAGVVQVWDTVRGTPIGARLRAPDIPEGSRFGFGRKDRLLALSPDGSKVAIAVRGTTTVWSVGSSDEPRSFRSGGPLWTLRFSHNGQVLTLDWNASVPTPLGIDVFDLARDDHRVLPDRNVIALSPDGQRLLTILPGRPDYELWDLTPTGAPTLLGTVTDYVFEAAFSPDSTRLATALEVRRNGDPSERQQRRVAVYDARTGALLEPGEVFASLGSLQYRPDGQLLAGVTDGSTVTELVDVASRRPIQVFPGDGSANFLFTPDPDVVVQNGTDIRYWRLTPRKYDAVTPQATPLGIPVAGPVGSSQLAAASDGSRAAYVVDGGLQLLRPPPGVTAARRVATRVTRTTAAAPEFTVQAFSSDGALLATGTTEGTVILTDARRGTELSEVATGSAPVRALAFLPGRQAQVAVGTADGAVVMVNVASRSTRRVQVSSTAVTSLAARPDGRMLAVGDADGWITQASVSDATVVGARFGHPRGMTNAVGDLAYSPDGRSLTSFSGPSSWVWDVSTPAAAPTGPSGGLDGQDVRTFRGFSPDNRYFANQGAVVDLLKETAPVDFDQVLAFTAQGQVVGTRAGITRVWRPDGTEAGPALVDPDRLLGEATFGAVDQRGRLLAVVADDSSIAVWNLETGHRLGVLTTTEELAVDGLIAFDPLGTAVYTVDGPTALVWDVLSIDAACAIAAPDVHASQLLPYLDGRQPTACAGVLPA